MWLSAHDELQPESRRLQTQNELKRSNDDSSRITNIEIYQIDCVLIQNEHTKAEYVCIAYTTFTTTITNTTASLNFAASDNG